MSLTGNLDIDNEILYSLNLRDLSRFCNMNTDFKKLCKTNQILQDRINEANFNANNYMELIEDGDYETFYTTEKFMVFMNYLPMNRYLYNLDEKINTVYPKITIKKIFSGYDIRFWINDYSNTYYKVNMILYYDELKYFLMHVVYDNVDFNYHFSGAYGSIKTHDMENCPMILKKLEM